MVDYAFLSLCSAYVMYVIVTCSIIFCRYWVYKKVDGARQQEPDDCVKIQKEL